MAKKWFVSALVLCGAFLCQPVLGVVVRSSLTAPTPDQPASFGGTALPYADSVGYAMNTTYTQVRGGAVYIGQSLGTGWALSAYHITTIDGGVQQVKFAESGGDVSYNITQVIRLNNPTYGDGDICLLKLDGTPDVNYLDWKDISTDVYTGVVSIGPGRGATSVKEDPPGTPVGYNVSSSLHPMTWGQNSIDGAILYGDTPAYHYDWDETGGVGDYECALTDGDSGGGLFSWNSAEDSWTLAGIHVGTNRESISYSLYGQMNFSAALPYYYDDLVANIPEPTTLLLVAGGAVVVVMKRKRRRG